MHSRMYPTYRGAHANRGWMTESSEQSLRAEQRGKRLRLTRRRRLRTGREATLGSDEHRATGAASGTAASVHRAAGLPEATGSEAPAEATGAPQLLPRSTSVRRRHRNEGTGNRVSVNGARMLVRATGAGSSFGNGGRFADKTGSGWHRYRVTGDGADRLRSRATGTGANMGIARRAFGHDGRCVGRAKANARRSTSGGSSHLSGSPG